MEFTIFWGNEPVGVLHAAQDGLYWKFSCELEKTTELPLRIYVLNKADSEYLGIPDADGHLTARIPARHFAAEPDGAVASEYPRGEWTPWRGTLNGVPVEFCLLRRTEDGITAALPPEAAQGFDQAPDDLPQITLYGKQWASVPVDLDGHLPPIERDNGGIYNETTALDPVAGGLPLDDAAADRLGQDGRQADRPDL